MKKHALTWTKVNNLEDSLFIQHSKSINTKDINRDLKKSKKMFKHVSLSENGIRELASTFIPIENDLIDEYFE